MQTFWFCRSVASSATACCGLPGWQIAGHRLKQAQQTHWQSWQRYWSEAGVSDGEPKNTEQHRGPLVLVAFKLYYL